MRPNPVQVCEGPEQIRHGQIEAREAGDAPRDLRIANLSAAIAGGDLEASWQLGVEAIRAVLRERD